MNKIIDYIKNLWETTEKINRFPLQEEMIDVKAFTYRQYDLRYPIFSNPGDTINASLESTGESFTETVGFTSVIDCISIFRSKEAFGMTNVVGAAFGSRKK